MKNLLILALGLMLQVSLQAQSDRVFDLLESKNISALSALMADEVELCIEEGQDLIDKSEALKSIEMLLNDIEVKSCVKMHNGSTKKGSSSYQVGKLISTKKVYRVFVYLENEVIQEIRFDPF